MKANELRIGNHLNYKNSNDLVEVKIIHYKHFDCIDGKDRFFITNGNYEPRPLTEKELLKFEFIECVGKYGNYFKCSKLDGFRVWTHEENGNISFCVGRKDYENDETIFIKGNIEYVHQLQNLYFALTGEELNYKN